MSGVREQKQNKGTPISDDSPLTHERMGFSRVASLTFPPEPPVTPQRIDEQERVATREALRRGEIPQSVLESLLIVDPRSERAVDFHERTLAILKRHIPEDFWDFKAKPIRIVLSTAPEPNAFYITDSNPPIIGITAGMFGPCRVGTYTQERFEHLTRGLGDLGLKPGAQATPVEAVSDLAAVILHELTHAREFERRGAHANDKIEEVLAYTRPLEAMHRGKLDARAMYRNMLILLRPQGSVAEVLGRLVNPHPQNDNTLNSIRFALTQLSYERGRITPLSAPDTPEDRTDLKELTKLAKLPGPTHAIDRLLSPEYARASTQEQAQELIGLIKGLREYDWQRAEESAIQIEAFAKRAMAPAEEVRGAILSRIDDLHPSLSVRLYEATQTKEHREIPHQLQPLNRAMHNLVAACSLPTFSQSAIEDACARLLTTIDTIELLRSSRGRQFVCYLPLSQFPPATRDKVVPWESLRTASAASSIVTEAAIRIGFARDPVISEHLLLHPHIAERVLDPTTPGDTSFPFREVSWGPTIKVRNTEAFLHQGTFSRKEGGQQLVLLSLDNDDAHPHQHSAFSTASQARMEQAQGRVLSLAINLLNSRPLTDSSTEPERQWVLEHLSVLSESCEPKLTERPSLFGDTTAKLSFLTPATLKLAPDKASDIIYGYLQSTSSISVLTERQREVVSTLAHAIQSTGNKDVLLNLQLESHHIIPIGVDVKNLSSLPLAVALLTDTLSLGPQEKLSLLTDSMCTLIKSETDERLVFEVLRINEIISSPLPGAEEILSALRSEKTPWLGKYALTRYALREVYAEKDVPELLLALIRGEPERWTSESFIKNRVVAYEKQLLESLDRAILSSPIEEACDRFSVLNQHNLIPIHQRSLVVKKLLERIDKDSDFEKRLSLRLQVIGGLLDEDYISEADARRDLPVLIRKVLGPDDGSAAYLNRAFTYVAPLSEIASAKRRSDLAEALSREMVAQRPLAYGLTRTLSKEVLSDDQRSNVATGLDTILFAVQSGYGLQQRRALLRFLSYRWDEASAALLARDFFPQLHKSFLTDQRSRSRIQRPPSSRSPSGLLETYEVLVGAHLSKAVYDHLSVSERATVDEGWRSFLALSQAWHRQFGDSSLPAKSGIIHQILFPEGLSIEEEPHIRQYVAETVAPSHADHAHVVQRLAQRYLQNTPFVKREPLLTAIIVAAWKMGPRATLGRTMVEVACALGPAEVKMVQRMRGHTSVPENIRRDSATSVYQVGEPKRLELLDWVDQVRAHLVASYRSKLAAHGRPDDNLTLSNIGEIKGSGSMGVTVKVTFSNGDSGVLYLVRPFARERGEAGFGTFQRMAEGLADSDGSKDVILDLLDSAKRRIALEASAQTAQAQYDIGVAMYRNKKAAALGELFTFNAPQVLVAEEFTEHGRVHGYFLMEEVPGRPIVTFLSDRSVSPERKRATCAAIVAREIHNYLHFLIEPDRNEGNIFIDGSVIHHLDLKAMRPTPWSSAAKEEIAPFLVNGLSDALQRKQNLAELLADLGGDRSLLSEEGFELLTEIETGLMSLAPYINHLKTEDMQAIALGVLDAGMDPILAKAAAKPLPPLLASIGERYLKGERGFLIPKLATILKSMGLENYSPLIGTVTLPD